ncbi:MAG: universal stress protein [Archangium sp.]|nr:universal stress protein [Archangium sp.]MDP3152733.1 universal stress protein [Archangium sp.]MDP3573520.1 universal stress protein [Archangium sp.]
MSPLRSVLCAVDLSEEGDAAIRQADEVARLHRARLIAYHALPVPSRSAPLFPHLAQADNTAFVTLERRVLEALVARVTAVTGRASADFEVELGAGSAHSAIVEDAERLGVDLIVVGGGGPRGVMRAVLGAVAERVVRYAHCAVWVARPSPAAGPVIAASDLSDPSMPAIEAGVDFGKRRGVKVSVMHALAFQQVLPPMASAGMPAMPLWSPADFEKIRAELGQQLTTAVRRFDPDAEVIVSEGRPATLILELAQQRSAGLICVGTKGRSGLSRMVLGSVAEEVVRHAGCAVLVVRLPGGS